MTPTPRHDRTSSASAEHGHDAQVSDPQTQAIEAAAFRRLLAHLDSRKDVQNIDLMNLAGFCRNCLARWYEEAARERGVAITQDQARERIYGMPYDTWKTRFQTPAAARAATVQRADAPDDTTVRDASTTNDTPSA